MPPTSPPLSALLPPLVLGTATFNSQYNPDPYALPATAIVHRALSLGVRAFDTSPYYGPSEELLGSALSTDFVRDNFPRGDYFLLTKVGRVSGARFDYSAAGVRRSVERSLHRLRTAYLDCVYCHDVEFVTPAEVLAAVAELRRIRDSSGGKVRYVGISGYPVAQLCALAELVLATTGEPLDAVMSYANFTLQNSTLLTRGLARLRAAGVAVVPNASILGMGLLRRVGVPIGAQGDWHPAPAGLRAAVRAASAFCDANSDRLEKVAIRYAVEGWLRAGAPVGSRGDPASGVPWHRESIEEVFSSSPSTGNDHEDHEDHEDDYGQADAAGKLGVSVMGVSNVEELEETMRVWRSILDTLDGGAARAVEAGRAKEDVAWGLRRRDEVSRRVQEVRRVLGEWVDFAWDSPGRGFVREVGVDIKSGGEMKKKEGDIIVIEEETIVDAERERRTEAEKEEKETERVAEAPQPTIVLLPSSSPDHEIDTLEAEKLRSLVTVEELSAVEAELS